MDAAAIEGWLKAGAVAAALLASAGIGRLTSRRGRFADLEDAIAIRKQLAEAGHDASVWDPVIRREMRDVQSAGGYLLYRMMNAANIVATLCFTAFTVVAASQAAEVDAELSAVTAAAMLSLVALTFISLAAGLAFLRASTRAPMAFTEAEAEALTGEPGATHGAPGTP